MWLRRDAQNLRFKFAETSIAKRRCAHRAFLRGWVAAGATTLCHTKRLTATVCGHRVHRRGQGGWMLSSLVPLRHPRKKPRLCMWRGIPSINHFNRLDCNLKLT